MNKLQVILFLLLCVASRAQQPAIDSLKRQYILLLKNTQTIQRDSIIVENFATIWDKLPYEDFENLKKTADTLSLFAAQSQYSLAKPISEYVKCRYYFRTGQYSIALSMATKILPVFERKKHVKYLKLTNLLLASITGNSLLYYSNILTKNEIGLHFKHLNECEKIVEKYGDSYDKSKMALIYAFSYLVMKDYKNSYKYYKSSADIIEADSAKQFYAYYNSRWAQGLSLLHLNKPTEGFKWVNKVQQIAQAPRADKANLLLLHNINIFMAEYYLLKNQIDTSIVLAKKALQYSSDKSPLSVFQKNATEILYKAYQQKLDYKNANAYLIKLIELQKSDELIKFNQNVSEWQVIYEDEKKQSQIKTLENEKLLAQAQKQGWLRNILILGLLAGLGFIFYFYKNNQKLIAKNTEIAQALLKGQTLERKRVAQELHDNLSAKISGIRWRLEAIKPIFETDKAQIVYDSSVNALAEVYADVRLIAHNLLPDELETKGLKVALEKLITELNSLGKTFFENKIDDSLERFSSKIEYEIYSCILELSNNVLKHAQASKALIKIEKLDNMLVVVVQDNGIGLSNKNQENGMGMANIQSRVAALNGQIQYTHSNGLCVTIKIPS